MTDYWFSEAIFRRFCPFLFSRQNILPLPRSSTVPVYVTCVAQGWTNAIGGPYDGAALIAKEENWVLDPRRKPTVSP